MTDKMTFDEFHALAQTMKKDLEATIKSKIDTLTASDPDNMKAVDAGLVMTIGSIGDLVLARSMTSELSFTMVRIALVMTLTSLANEYEAKEFNSTITKNVSKFDLSKFDGTVQ